ncbi:hypothetical protein [Aquabacterium sp. NJ1]|uniref:hypothetical protein n=1 Tax=Aquabacterium sp. NJ1 TaxID=1538295 RepID=UPI00068C6F99|nr:hypothetical protein [Aquabacterium sp. NJ1]
MNRGLLLALALVGGLSLYLGSQSDDDLLAPSRQAGGKPGAQTNRRADEQSGERGDQPDRHRATGGSPRAAEKRSPPMAPWLADGLTQGVVRWQARWQTAQASPASGPMADATAWRSVQPPPPPPPPRVAVDPGPPPAPTAPPFPHAWVGRFNDEPVAMAASGVASGASAPVSQAVARAVLAGPQNTWVVRAGDVIEGQWRVDRIQDRTMSLTYLPLKQQQTVVMR